MKKAIKFIIIGIIALIIIAIVTITALYINMMNPVSKNDEKVSVTIPKGATATSIGKILKDNNLIKSAEVFKLYTKLNNVNSMQAGEYDLNKNMSVSEIVEALEKGTDTSKKTIDITFLEGKNMRWIAKIIASKTNNTEQDVFNKLKDEKYLDSIIEKYWFITKDIKNKDIYYSLEGYLFPDTYNFKSKDVTVEEIFKTMLDQTEKKLEKYKEEIQERNISVHKLLTVASVVELEAAKNEDRAGVAGVIYNRIEKNMSLGSDVTTYYAIKVDMSERDLKQSELNLKNPYNTRGPNMEGKIPVGPISTVGIESINAALHPDNNDYLYFVADKNGKVYFAKDISGHEENIKMLRSKGLWYTY